MTAIPLVADCGSADSRLATFKNAGMIPAMANKEWREWIGKSDGVGDVAVERAA